MNELAIFFFCIMAMMFIHLFINYIIFENKKLKLKIGSTWQNTDVESIFYKEFIKIIKFDNEYIVIELKNQRVEKRLDLETFFDNYKFVK